MLITNLTSLYNINQIRSLEDTATKKYQISAASLMQRAGKAALQVLLTSWPKAKNIAIICGKGNNGGDGHVLARLAKESGLAVTVFQVTPTDKLSGIAKEAAIECQQAKIPLLPFTAEITNFDVLVDALFGIGLTESINEKFVSIIEAINDSNIPVLAIDIPSGLDANTGNVLVAAVHASITITFVAPKQGLFTGDAKDYCGIVQCDDLDLPNDAFTSQASTAELSHLPCLLKKLPRRSRTAHKGNFGHVLVIGGDYGMGGAPRLTAEAALRVGAGLISVVTRREHVAIINAGRPEIMCHGTKNLAALFDRATTIVIGPGLGKAQWGNDLWQFIINNFSPTKQYVIDADALNFLALAPQNKANWILTPHPGEAARLLALTSTKVQTDRFQAASNLQTQFGGVCVLKGSGTLIYDGKNPIQICVAGNPGMASGGMGDILSGMIGGLLAQKLTFSDAASLGVTLHAEAADLAAHEHGERGLTAMDLLPYVQKLLNCK